MSRLSARGNRKGPTYPTQPGMLLVRSIHNCRRGKGTGRGRCEIRHSGGKKRATMRREEGALLLGMSRPYWVLKRDSGRVGRHDGRCPREISSSPLISNFSTDLFFAATDHAMFSEERLPDSSPNEGRAGGRHRRTRHRSSAPRRGGPR